MKQEFGTGDIIVGVLGAIGVVVLIVLVVYVVKNVLLKKEDTH
jgi:hypothetical protein